MLPIAEDGATLDPVTPEQRLLEAVNRASAHFVYVVDLDLQIARHTNRSVLAALGHGVTAPVGLDALSGYLHPRDRDHFEQLKAQWAGLADDSVCEGERRLRHADGSYHWFMGRETVLSRHPDGRVARILGTLLDITDMKRAEETLRDGAAFLRLSQEAGRCGSWEVNLLTNRTRWSSEFARIYGLDPGQTEGAFGERIQAVHPDDREMVLTLFKHAVETGEQHEAEYRIRRGDGEERVVWARGGVVSDDTGRATRVIGTAVDITERKRAEKAMLENEALLRGLLETSPIPTLIVTGDHDHRILSINRRFTEVFGYTLDDLQDVHDWWPRAYPDPTYRTHVKAQWSHAITEATIAGRSAITPIDALVTCRDGRQRSVEVHMGWFGDRALVLFNDLTDRKRAEETLERISEAVTSRTGPDFFRSLASHLSESCKVDYAFVGMVDDDAPGMGRAIAVSYQGTLVDNFEYALKDTPCEHVVGRTLCHYPTGVQTLFPRDLALAEMGVDSYMGIPLFSSNGKALGLIVLLHGAPIPHPEQAEAILRVVAVRASAELEREMAEHALRASEARHRAILESSLDGLIVFEQSGTIVEFNAAAEGMFGERRDRAIGRNIAELIMPKALSEQHGHSLLRYLDSRTSHPTGQRIEMPAVRVDGTEFRVELSAVGIGGTRPPLYAAVVRDITERLMLEEQLRQSQKLQAIGQLAGGVAHDFNNLLTVIMGYSDMLLASLAPGQQSHEAAAHIHDAGERAALLTRQLLLFGRKAILEPRPLDLNAVIDNTGAMLRRLIGEHVTFATVLTPSLAQTKIDRGQIEQVIVNLCINARDAMPDGGRITVETRTAVFSPLFCRTHPMYRPGRFVELGVTDTGTGMPPEIQAHLFEPFFTTKGPGKGTGLGLATVYGIVQQAGGFITVDSHVGTGSTFRVFLPTDEKAAAPEPAGTDAVPGRLRTVLLVEDEAGVRGLAKLSLERHGYTVLSAGSGPEALAVSDGHKGPIDILVTDVVMGEMNGREVSERLRAQRPGLKVLFMSGYNDDEIVRHGIVDSAFLQKPFDLKAIARRVGDILAA